MSTVTVFLRGDQIGTYDSLSSGGNANGVQVTLSGVQTLGGPEDVFRVVVNQVGGGQGNFNNGQRVEVFDADDNVVLSALNPQHDQFQGRASSATHQIFTNQKVVFMVDGVSPDANGQVQFGPGANPPRSEQLPFEAFPSVVPCFLAATRLATPDGPRAVETLRPGDLVTTLDDGPQPLVWVGRRRVVGRGSFAPVGFAPQTLGNRRWLMLSPQHRVLLSGPRVELAFAVPEVLAPAVALVDGRRVRRMPMGVADYVNVMCAHHHILIAEGGAACESFLPGRYILGADAEAAAEILALFPEMAEASGRGFVPAARRLLSVGEARGLLQMTAGRPPFARIGAGAEEGRREAAVVT